MGGYFSTTKTLEPDFKAQLRKSKTIISTKQLQDMLKLIDTQFSDTTELTYDECHDIFSELIDMWEELYCRLKGEAGNVDIYQASVIVILYSDCMFEEKLKSIFEMFDCDSSGDLCYEELLFLVSSCVYAFRKLLGIMLPKFDELNKLSLFLWVKIDTHHNGVINYEEFCNFVEGNEEIQESFITHLDFQLRTHALKRYNNYMNAFINCFVQSITEDSDKTTITHEFLHTNTEGLLKMKLFSIVGKLIYKLHRSILNKVISSDDFIYIESLIKKYNPRIHIYFYFHLIKAISSFLATECSGDKLIDINEFRTLLWLVTGDEPTSERMKNEIKIIDINKDGNIQIKEWLNFIMPIEEDSKYCIFDFSLRKLFDSYDSDKNGMITYSELLGMLNEMFKEDLAELSEKHKANSIDFLQGTAKKLMEIYDTDHSCTLDWSEFKQFMKDFKGKETRLKKLFEAIVKF